MYRRSTANLDTDMLGAGSYRVGQFVIVRAGSRWRVLVRKPLQVGDFATLRSAMAWCHLDRSAALNRQDFKPTE
jgi:hypothetical protein